MVLKHFNAVRCGTTKPRFHDAKSHVVSHSTDLEALWEIHDNAIRGLSDKSSGDFSLDTQSSLLDLKIALASAALESCDLCPHLCHVNRNRGKVGYCGVADQTAVHWEGILHGEEIELVPSHEVFLSGCTMRCAFCYSHEHITQPMSGQVLAPEQIAACAQTRFEQGATNLNFVGGEPTVHLVNILRTLRDIEYSMPIVWNSNMYMTPKSSRLLNGVVDLYLGDIHFGNDVCARELGRIPDYLPSVCAALQYAVASGASVVIRHLVMPGHLECCARPAMQWAKDTLPQTPFHLMLQYIPDFRAEGDAVLGRPLSVAEMKRVQEMAREIGVFLYREIAAANPSGQNRAMTKDNINETPSHMIGENVDILIHDDGRVSFTRLTPELLPVAQKLNGEDERIASRCADKGRPIAKVEDTSFQDSEESCWS